MTPTEAMTPQKLAAAVRVAKNKERRTQAYANRIQAVAKRVQERIAPAINAHRDAETELRHLRIAWELRNGIPKPLHALRKRFVRWRSRARSSPAPWQLRRAEARKLAVQRTLRARCPHPYLLNLPEPDAGMLIRGDVVSHGHRECVLCSLRETRMYTNGRLSTTLDDAPGRMVATVSYTEFDKLAEELLTIEDVVALGIRFRTIANPQEHVATPS